MDGHSLLDMLHLQLLLERVAVHVQQPYLTPGADQPYLKPFALAAVVVAFSIVWAVQTECDAFILLNLSTYILHDSGAVRPGDCPGVRRLLVASNIRVS